MIDRLTGRTFAAKAARNWGLWAYARFCEKAGVDFVDCYVGVFGMMPRTAHIEDTLARGQEQPGFARRVDDLREGPRP